MNRCIILSCEVPQLLDSISLFCRRHRDTTADTVDRNAASRRHRRPLRMNENICTTDRQRYSLSGVAAAHEQKLTNTPLSLSAERRRRLAAGLLGQVAGEGGCNYRQQTGLLSELYPRTGASSGGETDIARLLSGIWSIVDVGLTWKLSWILQFYFKILFLRDFQNHTSKKINGEKWKC